jgi:hypothetical protein
VKLVSMQLAQVYKLRPGLRIAFTTCCSSTWFSIGKKHIKMKNFTTGGVINS